MLKRTLATLLCMITVLALFPLAANAEVLSGWTSKVDYENTDPNRYSIEIDLKNQIITVYEGPIGGPIVLQSLCTTGDAEHATNAGTYKLGDMKERFGYFVAFGQYAQYWTQVVRGIYIHSVMYNSKKLTSMSSGAYRKLGKNVSHGCVRVLPHVAKFIFYNCPPGTLCVVNRKKAPAPELVKRLKAEIPAYANYQQPKDDKPYPKEIPAVIRYDGTPLRTGFSKTNDTTVATLMRGDKVMLLQLAKDWCKVRTSNGKLGYVKTPYILAYPDSPAAMRTAYIAKSKTYLYKSMDTGSEKLVSIPGGAEANVVSNPKKGWWYGSFNGVEGYMRTKYVIKQEAAEYPSLAEETALQPQNNGFGLMQNNVLGQEQGIAPVQTPTPAAGGTASASSARIAQGIMANMRSGAGKEFPVTGSFPAGTEVSIINQAGTWYYCQAGGKYGYIYSGCLSMY